MATSRKATPGLSGLLQYAAFGHRHHVEHLVGFGRGDQSLVDDDVTDRAAVLLCLPHDARRGLVADEWVERGGDRRRRRGIPIAPLLVCLDAVDALVGERS